MKEQNECTSWLIKIGNEFCRYRKVKCDGQRENMMCKTWRNPNRPVYDSKCDSHARLPWVSSPAILLAYVLPNSSKHTYTEETPCILIKLHKRNLCAWEDGRVYVLQFDHFPSFNSLFDILHTVTTYCNFQLPMTVNLQVVSHLPNMVFDCHPTFKISAWQPFCFHALLLTSTPCTTDLMLPNTPGYVCLGPAPQIQCCSMLARIRIESLLHQNSI